MVNYYVVLCVVGGLGALLVPGDEVMSTISPGEIHIYGVPEDLGPLEKYEIRISYLGTVGAAFSLQWKCGTGKQAARRLLDTEKLVFTTDSEGKMANEGCAIQVKMSRNTRGRAQSLNEEPVDYFIQLEKYDSVLAVPNSVVHLIVLIVVTVLISVYAYKRVSTTNYFRGRAFHED